MAQKERAVVCSQEELAPGIFSMWLSTGTAKEARPGQFVSLYSRDGARLLPRPISICQVDEEDFRLRLVYRVAGAGTKEFSALRAGDTVEILGPLGNGFPLEGKKVFLVGGGIGIPPMLELARQLNAEKQMVLGYRDKNLFLKDEFETYGDVYVATEDGSAGTKGTVLDAIKAHALTGDVMFACGPAPMLRALKEYAAKENIRLYISLEERMACGIGACLACVCRTKEVDAHSHVHNARICKDGPVFEAGEVEL